MVLDPVYTSLFRFSLSHFSPYLFYATPCAASRLDVFRLLFLVAATCYSQSRPSPFSYCPHYFFFLSFFIVIAFPYLFLNMPILKFRSALRRDGADTTQNGMPLSSIPYSFFFSVGGVLHFTSILNFHYISSLSFDNDSSVITFLTTVLLVLFLFFVFICDDGSTFPF